VRSRWLLFLIGLVTTALTARVQAQTETTLAQQAVHNLSDEERAALAGADWIETAAELESAGNPDAASVAMATFLETNDAPLHPGVELRLRSEYAIAADTERARGIYLNTLEALKESINSAYDHATTARVGLIETGWRAVSWRRKRLLTEARDELLASVDGFRAKLVTDPSLETVLGFNRGFRDLLMLYSDALQALGNRWETARDRATHLRGFTANFKQTRDLGFNSRIETPKLIEFIQREGRNEVLRAWVNPETISVGIMSALLVAEGVCVVATVGVCSPVLAGTLASTATMTRAARGLQVAERLYFGGSAAIRLVDVYRLEGASSLLSLASAIDALLVVACLPAPSAELMQWAPAFRLGARVVRGPKLFQSLALVQRQSSVAFGVGALAYGSWQIARADKLAEELSRGRSTPITASEIRRQGVLNLVTGAFMGHVARQNRVQGTRASTQYAKLMEEASFQRSLLSIKNKASRLLIHVPARNFVRAARGLRTKPLGSLGKMALASATMAYDAFFYAELALMSYTLPDFAFANGWEPLPELKPGEIAVTLNGFDPLDLLYSGFKSRHSRRDLLGKYEEGVTYFDADFETPDDLLQQIERLSRRGKIRYLRIAAHGIPGRVASRAISIEGEDGFIDERFLQANRDRVRKLARQSIAPDAQVTFVSCLVGANLDQPMQVHDMEIPVDAGDRFARAFGDTLLVGGGTLQTSRRMVMAFDATMGAAFDATLASGIRNPQSRAAYEREILQLRDDFERSRPRPLLASPAARDDEDPLSSNEESPLEAEELEGNRILFLLQRLKSMSTQMISIIQKYGVNIEGANLLTERARVDRFAAQAQD
jgi:hypothetical protein